jgi:CBS domain-containing protein
MFVSNIMKSKHQCVTVLKDDKLVDALQLLTKHDIQSMPVLQDNKFIGMISKQIIYEAYFTSDEQLAKSDFLHSKKVGDVAKFNDLYITKEEVFERTLTKFKDFPILAVVDEHKNFLGIIARYEVLEQFESAFGLNKPGVRIAFTSVEEEGRISKLADIIKSLHNNIIAIATFDETDKLVRRIVIKIEKNENVDRLMTKLEKSGFRILNITEME